MLLFTIDSPHHGLSFLFFLNLTIELNLQLWLGDRILQEAY